MRILKITLDGYKNFHLRSIQTLVYVPTEKTQIVLGSNGSGKTSLLRERSPLPADHRQYLPEGSKVIELEHQGARFTLSSLFSPDGHRYLFVKDGEELNPGESVTVYRELVKSFFNYTQDIHDILIDVVSFDTLDVAKRRALFMRMSDQDYTYAVRYYKKLTESARDLQGSIKMDKAKLVKETDRLLSPEDESKVRQDISEVRETITSLLSSRAPKLQNLSTHHAQLEQLEKSLTEASVRLEKLVENIKGSLTRYEGKGVQKTVLDLEPSIRRKSEELNTLQALISSACTHLERLEKSRAIAVDQSQQKVDYLKSSIAELGKSIDTIRKGLLLPVVYEDPKGASEQLPLVLDNFEALALDRNDAGTLDPMAPPVLELEREVSILTDRLLGIESSLTENAKKLHTLEHYRSKGETECPNCHHSWIPNYDPQQAHLLEGERGELQSLRVRYSDRLEFLKSQSVVYQRLFENRRRILETIRSAPALTPLFQYLKETYDSTDQWLTDIQYAPREMGDHLRIQTIREKMEAVTRELAERVTDTPVDITIVDREIAEITESLHNHQSRHRTLLEELHLDRQLQSSLNQANELSSRIIDLHRRRDASTKEEVVHYIASLIDEVIVMHNLRLTSLERSLTTIDIQKGIVSSLEKSISAKEFDLRLLKLAISALSPTEGLIARGMGGFINRFVHDVNAFIENFWLYPLALETMDVSGDEVDLDYKFMVRVNSDHVVKDIQESSRGQREVINLAIRATCMKYLGLRQYPLFLDEFAARMDPAHRKAAYDAIDKLIESEEYSQIFLVSHYQEGYGALTDSEILVLCDSNVRMPQGLPFNKHVTMTLQ